ncbi:hypothetical protein F4808DRAFT_44318 [Astrocystis sublimbata]|nr:hypothetical protein F4808DRAFT_44318 [Astrocystis sublimbata]
MQKRDVIEKNGETEKTRPFEFRAGGLRGGVGTSTVLPPLPVAGARATAFSPAAASPLRLSSFPGPLASHPTSRVSAPALAPPARIDQASPKTPQRVKMVTSGSEEPLDKIQEEESDVDMGEAEAEVGDMASRRDSVDKRSGHDHHRCRPIVNPLPTNGAGQVSSHSSPSLLRSSLNSKSKRITDEEPPTQHRQELELGQEQGQEDNNGESRETAKRVKVPRRRNTNRKSWIQKKKKNSEDYTQDKG